MGVLLSFLPQTLIYPTVEGGVWKTLGPLLGHRPSVGCWVSPSQRVSLGCPGCLLFAGTPFIPLCSHTVCIY